MGDLGDSFLVVELCTPVIGTPPILDTRDPFIQSMGNDLHVLRTRLEFNFEKLQDLVIVIQRRKCTSQSDDVASLLTRRGHIRRRPGSYSHIRCFSHYLDLQNQMSGWKISSMTYISS
ncbi:uncharacterized protein LOC143183224 [Calliopsis andreniformis]|uniref:uncharacterized protein LOC143183224 n=1 Tax=Calliopsis andreniformis TaxID=337506 RepID=UPI003FCCE69E